MSQQDWCLISIKQYVFNNSNAKDREFFETFLLGLMKVSCIDLKKIAARGYYDWYSCKKAYEYCKIVRKDRWPEAEKYIIRSPEIAYLYAKNVIKGRWPEAEKNIKKNSNAARRYAKYVLKGRWPEAEKGIFKKIKNQHASYYNLHDQWQYIKHLTKMPNKNFEKNVLEEFEKQKGIGCYNTQYVLEYILKFKKKRWEEIEMHLANSRYVSRYMDFLNSEEDKEEFKNKVLAMALSDVPHPNYSHRKNYAKEYLETSKEKVAV